jgi:Zn-dependent protease
MGWQDRDYNRSINYGGMPFSNPLMNLIFGSVPLGRWFGIHVRMHASLLWVLAFRLISAGSIGWVDALAATTMIFTIVLLHEFGHCIGAILVGGRADNILLWPLGGLAFTETAQRPWPRFVTVVCGPLVNVIIGLALGLVFWFGYGAMPPLNPLLPWLPSDWWLSYMSHYIDANPGAGAMLRSTAGGWLWWAYTVNLSILFFNLVPMYPLDGGKLAQIILWKPLGYVKSMRISCRVGMAGAVLLAIFGLFNGSMFTIFLAAFGFYDCFQQLRILKEMRSSDMEEEPYDLSAAWDNPDTPKARKKQKKGWLKSARKRALKDQAEQAKIDAILAKVKDKGLHSLTWWEKRTLRKATERQRQHDLASRL